MPPTTPPTTPPATPLPSLPTCTATCPLCGQPNQCAPARSGSFDTPCWCATVRISAAVLARIPPARQGQACVCPACAQAGGVAASAPAQTR